MDSGAPLQQIEAVRAQFDMGSHKSELDVEKSIIDFLNSLSNPPCVLL